jgi:glycosyltransferase involved in cell wall biosynthesis
VVLAVHFRISQSDEWADKGLITRGGRLYRSIRELERRTVPAVDGLVFVSSWARSAVRAWMPDVVRPPGAVIPNFVRAVPESAVAPRADLVSVGNLEAVKNHRYLFRVLAAARDRGVRYTLDVFGEGVEEGNLRALATELGISDQVRLCGFRRDVPELLSGYRLYVHASYSESSSLAIMEAMGAGLPVISSDADALPELFDDPEHGRFWPIDDPQRGAEILVDFLESAEEVRRAGRAAREKFRTDYDADVVAPRLVAFLRSAPTVPINGSTTPPEQRVLAGGDHGHE